MRISDWSSDVCSSDLAGHRTDVGAAMTADLRFVTHTAERHAHELAIDCIRDRAPERSLADAGRADEAQDRPLQLFHPRLHRQVFDADRQSTRLNANH